MLPLLYDLPGVVSGGEFLDFALHVEARAGEAEVTKMFSTNHVLDGRVLHEHLHHLVLS